ncbi:hypothetical protein [Nocardioides sp. T2.26MG-1]|uniref:hypothetical protein n=1 Tax=Nocardioides sp. T2.26MG-1 TaxID=3041166 RepID=UPI0024779041|nr:hypothetical protein [Nocardioides sp. T2.26MG-1]CAI9413778.1 hypothetical protein HIDPHFAB_02107 [Nocardioides sp. T2.26MG-1]
MPVLSLVYPWPAKGRADRPTDEDEVADVAIRACRSVAELYSEALGELGFTSKVTELRIFTRHDPDLDEVRVTVSVDPVREGCEVGHVSVPTGFLAHSPRVRAEMLLEAVHGIVTRLALARGWDADALEACRRHCLDRGLEYRWSSAPKVSPDRRHVAQAAFRLAPDGYGRVRLLVTRRDDGVLVASSDEALAFCTSEGFRRAARSMRWHGKDRVAVVPYDFVPAIRGGELSLSRVNDSWRGTVADYLSVRPVPEGDPALPPLTVRVEGRGATAIEQPPDVSFVGGGPIESLWTRRFHRAFSAEMDRLGSPSGHVWWAGSGIRLLEVQIWYGGDRARVRSRRSDQRLRVFVDQPDLSASDRDPATRARQVAESVVALVRRRTGLGPLPELEFPSSAGSRLP